MARVCKVTVVGDGNVGKTSLLQRYAFDKYPDQNEYIPTVFESFSKQIKVDNQVVLLKLFDTAGQEGYDKLRILAYEKTDVFIICYAANNKDSLNHCQSVWLKELQKYCKKPYILVGTKADLISNPEESKLGEQMKKQIKASSFVLTSSVTGKNVETAILEAVRVGIKPKTSCNIL